MATEFFLFLLKPRRGDRRFSAAPTGAHTGKENKVRGLSFTNGSRRGLFSAVPSALKTSRLNHLHLPPKTATPAAREKESAFLGIGNLRVAAAMTRRKGQ